MRRDETEGNVWLSQFVGDRETKITLQAVVSAILLLTVGYSTNHVCVIRSLECFRWINAMRMVATRELIRDTIRDGKMNEMKRRWPQGRNLA